ncbi:hypothetical protein PYW08_015448 [Mythimna loreyi]|uniref:Uncharacterized protein n=1 Tax=Mythimna loreyi TaxID=667449 RepID=A0ACC2QW89_9NEOP|nr:hypothetical protein PYW08_015448 [Mythimna loreyi]
MRSVIVLAVLLAAEAADVLKDPGDLALVLDEEQFEDYLDNWLAQEQYRRILPAPPNSEGCTFKINGHLGQPQPVFLRHDSRRSVDRYLVAEENTGRIHINKGEQITVACPGTVIRSTAVDRTKKKVKVEPKSVAKARCVKNYFVSGEGWLQGEVAFNRLVCSEHLVPKIQTFVDKKFCQQSALQVGYIVENKFHELYRACFDQNLMQVLYVQYAQTPAHVVHQTGVPRPSKWLPETYFPGVNLDTLYTQTSQKSVFASYVGPTNANKYITRTKQRFLAKGHLAAKSDFVFASAQRATFFYINAAPQWQCINAGNWNKLEQNLRARIGFANYNTIIYTGTFGVMQLPGENDKPVDVFLTEKRQGKVPVPLYFYKVVYDVKNLRGTVFITINNPHLPLSEAESMAQHFCEDQCHDNVDFDWLKWEPRRVEVGYSFCCKVDDFRKKVNYLPSFKTDQLLF